MHQHDINADLAVENDGGRVGSCGAGRNRLLSGTREGSNLPRREGLERSRGWPTGVKYRRKILHCTGLIHTWLLSPIVPGTPDAQSRKAVC